MVPSVMKSQGDEQDNMQTIYRAAQVIRKSIATFTKTAKDTNIIEVTSDIHDIPAELHTTIHWIMIGPAGSLETQRRTKVVDRAALMASQNIIYGFKSNGQVNYKPRKESATFRLPHSHKKTHMSCDWLTVHCHTHTNMLMDLLSAHDYCVPYCRTLLLETAPANAVSENTLEFQGLYV